jgi:hypothetical protein
MDSADDQASQKSGNGLKPLPGMVLAGQSADLSNG